MRRVTTAFSLITVCYNPAGSLTHSRGSINIRWMNEYGEGREGERRRGEGRRKETWGGERGEATTLYVKKPGLCSAQTRLMIHQRSDEFWKAPHAMHSCKYSSCHAKELKSRTMKNSTLCFSLCPIMKMKSSPLSIYLSALCIQHAAFSNTKLTLPLNDIYVDSLSDITAWKDTT